LKTVISLAAISENRVFFPLASLISDIAIFYFDGVRSALFVTRFDALNVNGVVMSLTI
jgi:hypothetical protein